MKPTHTQQFTAEQTTLTKALKTCSVCLSDNRIMPAYEMFKFAINGNTLTISACDGMASITSSIPIQSEIADLDLLVPGKEFADYISKSANEILLFDIDIYMIPEVRETKEHHMSGESYEAITPAQTSYSLVVKSSKNPNNKAKFPCELGDNFPTIANESSNSFILKAEDLNEILYKTMFGISNDQLRPAATGLHISIEPGKLIGTSLNFDLVASHSISVDLDFVEANFIIPKKSLQQLQSVNPSGSLSVSPGKTSIKFIFSGIEYISLLIDEKYPDYKSVIPINNPTDFVTSRLDMIASIKRILPFSDAAKLLKLQVDKMSLSITAENIDYSKEASEFIMGAISNGEPILIGAKGTYLLDILNSFVNDEVWFSFSEPNKAIIITDGKKHENPDKENLVILMPIFLNVKK